VSPSSDYSSVALKLKYHRLKPVVFPSSDYSSVALKLKYHRLKPVVSYKSKN
jgi:hypothetical protein